MVNRERAVVRLDFPPFQVCLDRETSGIISSLLFNCRVFGGCESCQSQDLSGLALVPNLSHICHFVAAPACCWVTDRDWSIALQSSLEAENSLNNW